MLKFNKAICIALSVSMGCFSVEDSFGQSSNPLNDLLNGIVDGLNEGLTGQVSYKSDPSFIKYVLPFILDMGEFDKFMDKYRGKTDLTEKDGVYIIISLGFLQFHPDWISKDGYNKIKKYYPGIINKKADIEIGEKFAYNNVYNLKYDFPIIQITAPAMDMGPLPKAILGGAGVIAGRWTMAVATLTLLGLSFYEAYELLTAEGKQAMQAAQSQACQQPDVSCVAAPETPKAQPVPDTAAGSGKGKWLCAAQCNVQQIDPKMSCPDRVFGASNGPSEDLACREAKRVATQSTPRGCYPRHCKCGCEK